jgi:hypothetical protein
LRLTKSPLVLFVKVTYRVWMPKGEGLAEVLAVSQFCQPPVLLTWMVTNGVAVREPVRGGMVPRLAPDAAEARRTRTWPVRPDSKPELPTRLALAASAWPRVPGQRRDRASGQCCREERGDTVARA